MMHDVLVTINNSPSKIRKWGYLIKSDSKEEAKRQALQYAKSNANKPYSRYRKCSFEVKEEDVTARPDWQISTHPAWQCMGTTDRPINEQAWKRKMHLAVSKCICYNASRQKRSERFRIARQKAPVLAHWGFSIPFLAWRAYFHRLVTDYLLPLPNHLMMQWQATPATTALKNEVSISMIAHPLFVPVQEAATRLSYHNFLLYFITDKRNN